MARVSLAKLKSRSAVVSSLVNDVTYCERPNEDDLESLRNEYDLLYSDILDVIETLDYVLSDVEK
ncbi:hypothetical protein CLOBY_27530 [Clostridium saccharobutylicum]|uniref:hypothetical protein n=1 Tax=Clostridium saccharobutylicum TaxID=169679 RepID=UPI000983CC3D|nr:hypothetical protein [Clostridium saccharobutylicum]AQS10608.1 hypothetical protein CLOBY_27530 [Clostridium saccharobutylicum]MBC2438039.1 hypothetical protein [Clostridium saccharobutylicum]NSB90508.1 molybdopterin/thiamine biosynthesis adenylyltransferase [Clostridium saccharobutylicum]NYC31563.1 molybdopterin/thiamine biosynthesis adenylyltransferase [Clostridium saccharobutylicum]OOM18881.1 hypothetical protein CLSAB_03390 [Clostridium saccharobutylicum]